MLLVLVDGVMTLHDCAKLSICVVHNMHSTMIHVSAGTKHGSRCAWTVLSARAGNVPPTLEMLGRMSTLCCMSLALSLFSEVAEAAYILVIGDYHLQLLNLCTVLYFNFNGHRSIIRGKIWYRNYAALILTKMREFSGSSAHRADDLRASC